MFYHFHNLPTLTEVLSVVHVHCTGLVAPREFLSQGSSRGNRTSSGASSVQKVSLGPPPNYRWILNIDISILNLAMIQCSQVTKRFQDLPSTCSLVFTYSLTIHKLNHRGWQVHCCRCYRNYPQYWWYHLWDYISCEVKPFWCSGGSRRLFVVLNISQMATCICYLTLCWLVRLSVDSLLQRTLQNGSFLSKARSMALQISSKWNILQVCNTSVLMPQFSPSAELAVWVEQHPCGAAGTVNWLLELVAVNAGKKGTLHILLRRTGTHRKKKFTQGLLWK